MPTKLHIKEFFIKNRVAVDIGLNAAGAFTDFALTKSYFSFVRGGFDMIKSAYISYLYDAGDYFAAKNGWSLLCHNKTSISFSIFEKALNKLPSYTINGERGGSAKIFQSPVGELGCIPERMYDEIFYKTSDNAETVVRFLSDELMKDLGSSLISLQIQSSATQKVARFIPNEIELFTSKSALELKSYITKAFDNNLHRSILLYGPPGTGKSSIAHHIISELKLKALRMSSADSDYIDYMRLIFDLCGFDTLLIDDIDSMESGSPLLLFLEEMKKKSKLIIGTCNSLKSFKPSIIRPGRFDKIIKIETLDENTVKNILGDLSEKWFEKTKHFPAAYLSEFAIANKLGEDLKVSFNDLQDRVANQLKEVMEN